MNSFPFIVETHLYFIYVHQYDPMKNNDIEHTSAEINKFTAEAGTCFFDPLLLQEWRFSALEINCLV